ncbi:hypothetical protein [Allostreptomyces psammosilenae]|uniref:Uncharacterized protein n=1 Tax=Allostreptomyces psammosilenae TaxID=1892865 RepID=A0A852ZMA3_9ACTN|nr:hypothetical protein [Allostreptomyces psammosilenae]NYI03529.1 hypothetical protein [Allostreptomyces psammosilenae]
MGRPSRLTTSVLALAAALALAATGCGADRDAGGTDQAGGASTSTPGGGEHAEGHEGHEGHGAQEGDAPIEQEEFSGVLQEGYQGPTGAPEDAAADVTVVECRPESMTLTLDIANPDAEQRWYTVEVAFTDTATGETFSSGMVSNQPVEAGAEVEGLRVTGYRQPEGRDIACEIVSATKQSG